VPYEDFVLNIQPDDYTQLNSKVQRILDSPKRLRHMQVIFHSFLPPTELVASLSSNHSCIDTTII